MINPTINRVGYNFHGHLANLIKTLNLNNNLKSYLMSSLQIRVCGRYRIEQKLYEGKNSSVYIGRNVQSDSDCAIKCESKNIQPSLVTNEGKVLQHLQGGVGIPHLIWFGQNGDFRFLVTELLGNNLEEYLDICGGKFSLKTTLMVIDKILSSIEFIHYKNYVHRDVKPQNFLMGLGKKLHQIYTIDLAYSTTYLDPKTREHRQNRIDENSFVGTLKFASLNVHKGNRNSRRDDLQSVALMMIYFLKGKLPWSNLGGENLKQKGKIIKKCMQQTPISKLCDGLPKQIEQFLQYARSLRYDDIPDYNYIRRMLKQRFIKQGYQFDYIYDWILIPLKLKDYSISNRIPLNRFTRKQNTSLSMCNCESDLVVDFQVNDTKIVEIPKQSVAKEQQIHTRTKRAMSNIQAKKTPATKTGVVNQQSKQSKGKNSKQDCLIF